ncbi:MAG: Carboxylesterase [Glaciihabitans sp.]|nr:Carboxylesterase [Glaciihabitans sp.]
MPTIEDIHPGPTVSVTGGRVQGIRAGANFAWRGIPYARAPEGDLRFRAPQPVEEWTGIRRAWDFGNVATQAYRGQFRGVGPGVPSGEDCLNLNVLRPADADIPPEGMPVMVFIHGGGYAAGSSRDLLSQGDAFVRSGEVIFVSFNYRLSVLGYLDFSTFTTPERPFEGNLGLRDQVAALRWVSDNIRAFGGDPENVTVLGESAGGNAVTTLFATPSAAGLFARGIAESSPANAVYGHRLATKWAVEFVEILSGLHPGEEISATRLLTETSATDLVTAMVTLQIRTPDADPGTFCLAPNVDGDFLPEHPMDAFRSGRAHRVPLIIGTNDREGSLFRGRIDILPRSPVRIRALLRTGARSAREPLRAAYPGLPSTRTTADFAGDFAFWYPSLKVAELHSRFAPAYSYRFDLAPRLLRVVGLDATHGVELLALIDPADAPLLRAITVLGGRQPFALAGLRMRRYWLTFAVTGRLSESWPAYREPDRLTLVFETTDRVESDPRAARRLAWDEFHRVPRS